MSKRSRKAGASQSVSLFPFLSILACVIGTLTLMIAALTVGQMGDYNVPSREDLTAVQNRQKADEDEIAQMEEELQKQAANSENEQQERARKIKTIRATLVKAREELKRLQSEVKKAMSARGDRPKIEIPKVDIDAHETRMAQIQSEIEKIKKEITQLQADIAKRKVPPDEAHVKIESSGSGTNLNPTFVECNATGLVIYDGPQPRRVRRAELRTDETYLALLDKIADKPKDTVIFLLRDNGLWTYYAARAVALERGVRNGKLPVVGKGKIDLSVFK